MMLVAIVLIIMGAVVLSSTLVVCSWIADAKDEILRALRERPETKEQK